MLLYSLSNDPSKPCFVLRFKGVVLMLDCGVSMQTLLDFLPISLVQRDVKEGFEAWKCKEASDPDLDEEIKLWREKGFVNSIPEFCPPLMNVIDFSEIDVILVSNYSLILGLPFITENTHFRGLVYATEPTLRIGRLLLQELVDFIGDPPVKKYAKLWKDVVHLPAPLCGAFEPKSWRKLFSRDQLNASLNKVKVVGYDELLDVYGAVQVKAVCSGYRLGSCNWVITTDFEKIVYVSTSSTLMTHRKPMDTSSLKDANALIMAGLRQNVTSNPENLLSTLCSFIGETVKGGGNALLPCYPSGIIYDLFECVSLQMDSLGLTSVPIFFISPVADVSLAYSNILGEWLSQAKQNKVYLPEEPFPHAYLVKAGRLKYFKRIYSDDGFYAERKEPCIIFCGHPSLRFGDVVHFIEEWGQNPQHSLILTEPDIDFTRALEPFQPLSMKVIHCPIDVSLNYSQANRLLKDLHPTSIAVPSSYTQLPAEHLSRPDLTINQELGFVQSIAWGQTLRIPVKRRFAKALLSPLLASRFNFTPVKPNIAFASVTGNLVVKDSNYILEELETDKSEEIPLKKFPRYEFGQVDIEKFIDKVKKAGLPEPFVQSNSSGESMVIFFGETYWIHFQKNETHIRCPSGKEQARSKLRAILMECLLSF